MDWALWYDSPASCPGQMEGTLCTISVQVTVETMGCELGVGRELPWKGQGEGQQSSSLALLGVKRGQKWHWPGLAQLPGLEDYSLADWKNSLLMHACALNPSWNGVGKVKKEGQPFSHPRSHCPCSCG